jgi:Putative lactococcus lactis phage r1t holin
VSVTFIKDLSERAVVTFLQAWMGAWLVLQDQRLEDLFDPKTLGVGVAAAIASVVKSLAARRIGDEESASLAPDV